MVDKLSWVLIAVVAVAILWRQYQRGWTLQSPAPKNPWMASAFLALAILMMAKRSWHTPDLRTNLNLIILMMVIAGGVQLYRTLRDSRRNQTPPAWASYGVVCLCSFLVADAVSFVLTR